MPWRDAVTLAAEVASALATAHACGVVHRDITPANIMLTRAGAKVVFAANGSVMMDETELEAPMEFREGRPDYQYLLFGWGQHRCFGKFISQVQITEIVRSLLVLDNLRRAPGAEGELHYEGFFPKSFTVEFG